MNKLKDVLERFSSRLAYRQEDTKALDLSRNAAAGNIADKDYTEWAMMTNDPQVFVNFVDTMITVLAARLTANPFRPGDKQLANIVEGIRLNAKFNELYVDVLRDGYSYLAVGCNNGVPEVSIVDSRYILFTGEDPTLKDSSDVVIFRVVPRSLDEIGYVDDTVFPEGFVDFDREKEKVITSYYHRAEGAYVLDIYENYSDEPTRYFLDGLDRIPVVRFVGSKVELSDRRFHYRGLYYKAGSVIKALYLSATKIQIHASTVEDANWITDYAAIDNEKGSGWDNSETKTITTVDANGVQIEPPQRINRDSQFLIESYNVWKTALNDMFGPIIRSGSEAVTEEEVKAANEVRDALTNDYISRFADSVAEVYRCIRMFLYGDPSTVIVEGGFIESVKRQKIQADIESMYRLGKDSGLNMQGVPFVLLDNLDIPDDYKAVIRTAFKEEPFKSPMVIELQNTVQQQQNTIQQLQWQLAVTKNQASSRLERQAEWTEMTERVRKYELMFKQWQEEQKQIQEARMEVLKKLLEQGNAEGVTEMLAAIQREDPPILAQAEPTMAVEATTPDYSSMSAYQTQPPPTPQQPQQQPPIGGLT